MRRRDIIGLIAGAAAAWPMVVHGQQTGRMRRIGVLTGRGESDPEHQAGLAAFRERLQGLGWTEGHNIQIAYRLAAEGSADRARALAAELVSLNPDAIFAFGGTELLVLLQQTRSIPIVFASGFDAVASGSVGSLARPAGNATGFIGFESAVGTKWLEILKEVAPSVTAVLILSPGNPNTVLEVPAIEAAVASLGLRLNLADIRDAAQIEPAIAAGANEPNAGMIVLPGSRFAAQRDVIIASAARHRLPAVYSSGSWVAAGGLVSFGFDQTEQYRGAAAYVDRILKGEKPSDLPIQIATKFELAINLKTAKKLGLTVPPSLLARADEVIE